MSKGLSNGIADTAVKAYETRLLNEIKKEPVPHHIAIIMDGNRRYARDLGLRDEEGYVRGRDKLEDVMNWCLEIDVKVLTVYAFSTENFKRSIEEIKFLMSLFYESIEKELRDERLAKYGIRVRMIGRRDLIPSEILEKMETLEKATEEYNNYFLNLALAYGGRDEIVIAIKKIAQQVKNGSLDVEEINEDVVSKNMYITDTPDPDLLLRTSGEERISNFLLWQIAYSEIYFSEVYWPTFKKLDFLRAVRSYQLRKRRYGR